MGRIFKNKLRKAKVIAGDDLVHLFAPEKIDLDNDLLNTNILQVSRERVHLAKFFFIFIKFKKTIKKFRKPLLDQIFSFTYFT